MPCWLNSNLNLYLENHLKRPEWQGQWRILAVPGRYIRVRAGHVRAENAIRFGVLHRGRVNHSVFGAFTAFPPGGIEECHALPVASLNGSGGQFNEWAKL